MSETPSYKLGCNFDLALIEGVVELNEGSRNGRINEFYGSDRAHAFLSARPAYRLPDVSLDYVSSYIRKCREVGIGFNYTLNSMYPGSKRFLASRKREIVDFIRSLINIGVNAVTVSTPILAEFVRQASETIDLEVSTITHIDTITQIKAWHETYGIRRVCGNLMKNRSVRFLKAASRFCNSNGITMNLMVNEFCSTGGGNGLQAYSTHCIYRDSCYLCHAENKEREDAEILDNYPMRYCIASRSEPSSWLKSPFIRPEDIGLYQEIGIDHFKITGRTGTTDYLLAVADAYLTGSWERNLLALWKPLQTVSSGEEELGFEHQHIIDNKKLTGFVRHWFENDQCDCSVEVCGETCNYCNQFYKNNIAP